MILRYATPVIALLIATLAVVGPTRAPNAVGREVITYWGWTTIAAAVVACVVALVQGHRQTRDEQRQRQRAEAAERQLEVVRHTALAELAPGVRRLLDVVTFGFLLPHLWPPPARDTPDEDQRPDPPEPDPSSEKLRNNPIKLRPPTRLNLFEPDPSSENPRHIPEALKLPNRLQTDPLSEEWIESLKKVNFIPRRSWSMPYRPLGSLDTFLNKQDPWETTVPYCLDGRQFHEIVSEEAKKAQAELKAALEKGAFIAFSSDVLETANHLIQDPYLQSLIDLAEWLERWIRLEDDHEDPEHMHLSMIDDRRTSIEDYKAFMRLLRDLDRHLGKIDDRRQAARHHGFPEPASNARSMRFSATSR